MRPLAQVPQSTSSLSKNSCIFIVLSFIFIFIQCSIFCSSYTNTAWVSLFVDQQWHILQSVNIHFWLLFEVYTLNVIQPWNLKPLFTRRGISLSVLSRKNITSAVLNYLNIFALILGGMMYIVDYMEATLWLQENKKALGSMVMVIVNEKVLCIHLWKTTQMQDGVGDSLKLPNHPLWSL